MQRVFRMLSMVELWLLAVSTFVMLYAHYLQVWSLLACAIDGAWAMKGCLSGLLLL